MKGLAQGFGRGLTIAFFVAVVAWGLVLIILPQLTMLERALTAPARQLDSSIALQLSRDANTCISVLKTYENAEPAQQSSGGLPVPSVSGMAVPSASTMAVPSASGMGIPSINGGAGTGEATRPYILQCDRATTHRQMVRGPGEEAWLDTLFDIPDLSVDDTDPIPDQIATAGEIAAIGQDLYERMQAEEAKAFPYSGTNFEQLFAARAIPMSAEQKAIENARPSKILYSLIGLRFERDGQMYERLGLVTLFRTLAFAVMATALALVLCYPVAYKVALATPPDRAVWLFLGLVIPYAIVELMRVYAWTTIIDTNGLINGLLTQIGIISEPIRFKRMPGTVFLVIVYTYVLFMVFPIFNVMSTLDRNQIEAARDLGASMTRVHRRIVIPHSKPGIAVGCIATFMLAAGAFSVPRIISRGLQADWFSQTIYNKFFESENSNVGAAYSFFYTMLCFAIVALFMMIMRTRLKDFARVQ
ncbi:ABC transporter permease [Chachezhania antarctica]|uniref:ABC transporter permease n=1 Tax=Chachezhania antarctica TaxID=2340860 RepID=UPI000EB31C59|nr:ABC transporter permease [Chachezhania antarctica]|tara:strand:+ start:653 stop:2074 length:1422 start_codon:yes stop_codon:yes gene_type:complete